jgi:CHAT domain-containing protein/tetratricopeptide (TPR) repeat protein
MARPRISRVLQARKQVPNVVHSACRDRRFRGLIRNVFFCLLLILVTAFAIPSHCRADSGAAPISGGIPSHRQTGNNETQSTHDNGAARAKELLKEGKRLVDESDFAAGEKSLREALAIYDSIPNPDVLVVFGQANCYGLLGTIAEQNGDDDKAIELWREAAHRFQGLEGGKLQGTVVEKNLVFLLRQMADLYYRRGQTEEDLDTERTQLEIQQRLGASEDTQAQIKNNIGDSLTQLGHLHEAEDILKEAVALSQTGNSPPQHQAAYLYALGLAEEKLYESSVAEQSFRKALAILDKESHSERAQAEILVDLANVLDDQQRGDEGRQQLNRALAMVAGLPELRQLRAKILGALALDTDDRLHRKEDAIKQYKDALSLMEGQLGVEEIRVICLKNLAVDLYETGKFDEAEQDFRQALAIVDAKNVYIRKEKIGELRRAYGLVLAENGKTSEAMDNLLFALKAEWSQLSGDLAARERIGKQTAIDNLFPLANLNYTLALRSPESLASRAYEVLLLTKALHTEATRAEQQTLLYSGTSETSAYSRRYVELRRQISRRTLDSNHTEVTESNEGLTKLASEANDLEIELRRRARPLQQNIQLKPVGVDQVNSQLRPGEVLLDYFIYSAMDLKTRTPKSRRYGVFRVEGTSGKIAMADLGEATSINQAVKAVRDCERTQADWNHPSFDEDQLAKVSGQLKQLVLDPILPSISNLKRIYVSPDGLLGLVPFDALPTAKTASGWRYLVEDVEVVHLLTGRDLTRASSQKSSSTEAWLFGDPDFDATPEKRLEAFNNLSTNDERRAYIDASKGNQKPVLMGDQQDSDTAEEAVPAAWQPLEGTRSLVTAIAEDASKSGTKTRTLLGSEASEEALSRVRAPRMLMFATHGYFMKSMPTVHLDYDSNRSSSRINEDLFETANPLHRSMIILAGANRRNHHIIRYEVSGKWITEAEAANKGLTKEELSVLQREVSDGLLTAYEIPGIDLEDTELVILAGCESGLGVTSQDEGPGIRQAQGESIAGLRQAFTVAGSRSVVTSLWPVPLDQTIDQMHTFVRGWLSNGLPRYRAFHESQLKALQAARGMNLGGHPFWWAGFVYFGDPGDR